MKRLILLSVVLSVGCAVAGWRGRFDEQFAAAWNAWPTWSTTPYPLSKAFAAYRRTFAEPDAVITYSDGPAHGRGWAAFAGGVVIPDGRVVLVPRNSPFIGIYDPSTGEYSDGPAHGRGGAAFAGGVVIPDGRVVLVPYGSSRIGILSAGAAVPLDACLSPLLNKL